MARTTTKELAALVRDVNRALEVAGSRARVAYEQRYDYHALDLTTTDYLEHHPGAAIRSLRLGTMREVADYLRAMREGLWCTTDYPAERAQV